MDCFTGVSAVMLVFAEHLSCYMQFLDVVISL